MESNSKEESSAHRLIRGILFAGAMGALSLSPIAAIADGERPSIAPVPTRATQSAVPTAHTSASDLWVHQSPHERILSGIIQGDQDNKTFSGVVSIIRSAFGAEDFSESMAAYLLMSLIKKYAQQVLNNLIQDAAKDTADWFEKIVREFAQTLSEKGRTFSPSPPSDQQIGDDDNALPPDDDALPPEVTEAINNVRDELIKQSGPNLSTPLDSRSLSAIQSPACGVAQAWLSHPWPGGHESTEQMWDLLTNPESAAELVPKYVRYRSRSGSFECFPCECPSGCSSENWRHSNTLDYS